MLLQPTLPHTTLTFFPYLRGKDKDYSVLPCVPRCAFLRRVGYMYYINRCFVLNPNSKHYEVPEETSGLGLLNNGLNIASNEIPSL